MTASSFHFFSNNDYGKPKPAPWAMRAVAAMFTPREQPIVCRPKKSVTMAGVNNLPDGVAETARRLGTHEPPMGRRAIRRQRLLV